MKRSIEVDTAAELSLRIESGEGLAGVVVQGVDLADVTADWDAVDVAGSFFLGCRIPDAGVALTLQRGGAIVVPELGEGDRPYRIYPSRLYSYDDLVATGLDAAVRDYFQNSRSRTGDPDPDLPVEAIAGAGEA